MAYEQAEAGFSYLGSEVVCESCIGDPALRAHVAKHANVDRCDFCKGDDGVRAIGLAELFMFMAQQLGHEYEPATSLAAPGTEWAVDLPRLSSAQLLQHLGAPLAGKELREAFCASFSEDWIEQYYWSGTDHERWSDSWTDFVYHVTSISRFVFLHPDAVRDEDPPGFVAPAGMLDALRTMIQAHGLVTKLYVGDVVYRGRRHPPNEVLTSFASLGPPAPHQSLGQRMSPRGVSCYYGASDEETCLAELRGVEDEVVSVAPWRAERDCWIVDLVNLRELPSIFDSVRGKHRPTALFLRSFADSITEPVHRQDDREVGYIPTQIVADYIRHCVRGAKGEAIDGIRYRSSVKTGGKNIVMFVDPTPTRTSEFPLALVGPVRRYRVESVSTAWARSGEDPITHAEPWWQTEARERWQQVVKYANNTVREP